MKKPKYTQMDVENLKAYKKTLRELDQKITRMTREREKLENKIDEISQITMFHDGYPVQILTYMGIGIHPVPDDGNRAADIYHNANKQPHIDDWGAHIRYWDKNDHRVEKWLGTGHKKADLMKIALDFVVHGKLPKEIV